MVGDYLLQTDWQARNKRGGLGGDPVARRALLTHVTTYTLAFVPALIWIARRARSRVGDRLRRADLPAASGDRRRPRRARSTWPASSGRTASTPGSPPRSTSPSTSSRCGSWRCWSARHEPRRRRGSLLAVALVAVGVGLVLDAADALRGVELATVDARFELRGAQEPPPDVVLVGIDDKTLGAGASGLSDQPQAPRATSSSSSQGGRGGDRLRRPVHRAERRRRGRRRALRGRRTTRRASCSARPRSPPTARRRSSAAPRGSSTAAPHRRTRLSPTPTAGSGRCRSS